MDADQLNLHQNLHHNFMGILDLKAQLFARILNLITKSENHLNCAKRYNNILISKFTSKMGVEVKL